MSILKEPRKQQLRVTNQLEIPSSSLSRSTAISDDFEGKLVAAQQKLVQLQQQQELIEKQKAELEELTRRKDELLDGQVNMTERLTACLTSIDRALYEMRQDMEDLEQTRKCFAEHQQKIDSINPDSWSREQLQKELTKSIAMLDHAEDEYDEAIAYFSKSKHSNIFGNGKKVSKISSKSKGEPSEFMSMFKQGIAFNLPIVILGAVALVLYFSR
jgi:predicted RNase H-like nuclease (RuvC/YqgF family)